MIDIKSYYSAMCLFAGHRADLRERVVAEPCSHRNMSKDPCLHMQSLPLHGFFMSRHCYPASAFLHQIVNLLHLQFFRIITNGRTMA